MAAPTVVGVSPGSGGNPTLPTGIQGGDLEVFFAYIIPQNEDTSSVTYGTITAPSGFTACSGSPYDCNAANQTTQNTQRVYVYYKYAPGTVGSASSDASSSAYTFSTTATPGALEAACIVFRGGPTSGDPSTMDSGPSVGQNHTTGNTTMPPVSLTLAGSDNQLLWLGFDHSFNEFNPTGWTSQLEYGYMSCSTLVQSGSGATGSIAPTTSDLTLTAILMNIAAPAAASALAPNPFNFTRAAVQRASTW
jgi:hypothetical protein